jgi:predicted site-specific integrase-resolvase
MTLEAVAQSIDVSVMTALRMIRHGIIKGRQLCRGAPWVIKAEDLTAYREQKASPHSLTSNPAQQRFQFQ